MQYTKVRHVPSPHKTFNLLRKTNTEQIIPSMVTCDKYVKSSEEAYLSPSMN